MQYLASIDSSNPTGILPPNAVEGTSKVSKASKMKKQVEKPPTVDEKVVKETIPWISGVPKRTKKHPKKPSHSPIKPTAHEPIVEGVEPNTIESLNHIYSLVGPKKVRKAHFTKKGVLFCDVLVPRSPASQKQRASDMAKKLNKKKHEVQVTVENMTAKTEHGSDCNSLF